VHVRWIVFVEMLNVLLSGLKACYVHGEFYHTEVLWLSWFGLLKLVYDLQFNYFLELSSLLFIQLNAQLPYILESNPHQFLPIS
jgi:hypothetical protein